MGRKGEREKGRKGDKIIAHNLPVSPSPFLLFSLSF